MPKIKKGGEQTSPKIQETNKHEWLDEHYEGQLAVDVYQDHQNNIVITSTVAGVTSDNLDISINNDMVTIRGRRRYPYDVAEDQYYYQECYWGGFSRSIILPIDVKAEQAKASLKNGVLTIIIPKADGVQVQVVNIKTEE
ncbi:MAG: Hsp20/alpha crystallin family protein [Patescibacteria group bacterium]|jgi:HSP20 family protein